MKENSNEEFASTLRANGSRETGANRHPKPIVPEHELLVGIGHGAYGEVWLARNAMGTHRAVKVVYRDSFTNQAPYEREFKGIQRYEPISRSHEGFVDILQIGRNDEAGYFYYVMELADDALEQSSNQASEVRNQKSEIGNWNTYQPRTLRSETQSRGRLPFEECLQLALSLNLTLGHLHRHGLIHRDIKPSNVIFVNGIPKLADIGLVTELSEARSLVGTEGFIPPEGPNSVQADIYSLGKVLYEISMGKDRKEFPEPFTALGEAEDSAALAELNAVIAKACATNPQERYQSTEEMHLDLALLHGGKSVRRKRVLERRVALLTKLSVTGVALTALIVAGYFYQRHQTLEARQLRIQAQKSLHELEFQRAHEQFEAGDSGLALAYLAKVLRREPTNRLAADRLMSALTYRNYALLCFELPLPGNNGNPPRLLTDAEFSPDSKWIFVAAPDGTVRFWDAVTGKVQSTLQLNGRLRAERFSANHKTFVTLSGPGTLARWDIRSGKSLGDAIQLAAARRGEFSADGRWIAIAEAKGGASIWDTHTGARKLGPLTNDTAIIQATLSPDATSLITVSEGGIAQLRDVKTGRVRLTFEHHPIPYWPVSFSPDGKWILSSGRSGNTARVWNTARGEMHVLLAGQHRFPIRSACFSPDSRRVVTASNDQTARLWDVRTGLPLGKPMRHKNAIVHAEFSFNGERVLTASMDGKARLWDAYTGEAVGEPIGRDLNPWSTRLNPDQSLVLSFIEGAGVISVWDVRPGQARPLVIQAERWVGLGGHNKVAQALFSPRGQRLLTITRPWIASPTWLNGPRPSDPHDLPGTARFWDPKTGLPLTVPMTHHRGIAAAQISRDGRWLITGSWDGEACIWDTHSGQLRVAPLRHGSPVTAVALSPDATLAATGCKDGTVRVWSVRTGRVLRQFYGKTSAYNMKTLQKLNRLVGTTWVSTVEFSPDGGRLLVATESQPAGVWIWDIASGRQIVSQSQYFGVPCATFSPDGNYAAFGLLNWGHKVAVFDAWTGRSEGIGRHEDHVLYLEFSPDGSRLISTSSDRTARIWKVRKSPGPMAAVTLKHRWEVPMARFSPDARRVVTASWDDTAQIWDAATGLALSEPLRHGSWVNSAEFNPQGNRVATVSVNSGAMIWYTPDFPLPAPSWLPDLAEALARLSIDESGYAQAGDYWRVGKPLGYGWWDYLLFVRNIRKPESGNDAYARWAKWFFADRRTRPIFPSSTVTVAELVRRLAEQDDPEALSMALELAPLNPTVLARMGWSLAFNSPPGELQVGRAEWLTRLASTLAPTDGTIWALRADVLTELGNKEDARQAVERALALTPDEANAWWAKAILLERAGREKEAYAAYRKTLACSNPNPVAGIQQTHPFLNAALREITARGRLNADKCVDLAKLKAADKRASSRLEANWLSRRAIELASPTNRSRYWLRRAEVLRATHQLGSGLIVQSPRSIQVNEGESAKFRVEVHSDEPVAFQWRRDEEVLPGATNATLALARVTRKDTAAYSVLVHGSGWGSRLIEMSSPAALTIRSGDLVYGGLAREVFRNLPNKALRNLLEHPSFPDPPDERSIVSEFETPPNVGENYVVRLSGILIPPVSGAYVFYLCADDRGALFLSRDDNPAHKTRIALDPTGHPNREWNGTERGRNSESISKPISLQAGRRYYVEAVMQQDKGDENLSVVWQLPGRAPPRNGAPPIAGRYLAQPVHESSVATRAERGSHGYASPRPLLRSKDGH